MRKLELPTVTRHILIYQEDWDFLTKNFGQTIGPGHAIRKIVHHRVQALRAKEIERLDQTPRAQSAIDSKIIKQFLQEEGEK